MAPATRLASAADLSASVLGAGSVVLRWTHPDDVATHGVRFDVYSSTDLLEPFRTRRLADVAATVATIDGLDDADVAYVTVVATRGELVALPSRVLPVRLARDAHSVPLSAADRDEQPASGLAFPFGITAAGSVRAQQGDPLLRARILQLLLTSPGERVNLPEYGTRLRDVVFDPGNDVLAATTEFTVTRALRRYLADQLAVESVQVASAEGELVVDIIYRRIADQETEQLRVGIPVPT